MARLLAILLVALAVLSTPVAYAAPPKQHKVAKGQTLGKIASRYAVTVDAICLANDITPRTKIKIGLKLLIPPTSDKDGSETRKLFDKQRAAEEAKPQSTAKPQSPDAPAPKGKPQPAAKVEDGAPRWHTVTKGQRLGRIAKRYAVTVEAIRAANDLGEKEIIRPGQQLIIPAKDDVDGSKAHAEWERRRGEPPVAIEPDAGPAPAPAKDGGPSWQKYVAKPDKPGYLTIIARKGREFRGHALTKSGRVRKAAATALQEVLGTSDGQEHEIDPRLVQLLTRVSDTFGGRTILVVSGYREGSTSRTSRHRHGKAIDFTIAGVPNTALRDYVKTLEKVGVGYYPNSSFVHLDVREQWTYWIDYSGPGQRPRYGGMWTRR